jgi:hypothetical protein
MNNFNDEGRSLFKVFFMRIGEPPLFLDRTILLTPKQKILNCSVFRKQFSEINN